jgi:hypothetical protein
MPDAAETAPAVDMVDAADTVVVHVAAPLMDPAAVPAAGLAADTAADSVAAIAVDSVAAAMAAVVVDTGNSWRRSPEMRLSHKGPSASVGGPFALGQRADGAWGSGFPPMHQKKMHGLGTRIYSGIRQKGY